MICYLICCPVACGGEELARLRRGCRGWHACKVVLRQKGAV